MTDIALDGAHADIARRLVHLQAQQAELDIEISELKAKLRSTIPVGGRAIVDGRALFSVGPNRRFDAKAAQAGLPPELVALCIVTEFSSKAAKANLPPALYDSFVRDAGEPVVRAL